MYICTVWSPVEMDTSCIGNSSSLFRKLLYALAVSFPGKNLTNEHLRHIWVSEQIAFMQNHHLDGVNVDFEQDIPLRTQQDGLSLLMWELYKAVKNDIGTYAQVYWLHTSFMLLGMNS